MDPSPFSPVRSLITDEPLFVDAAASARVVASMLHRFNVGAAIVAFDDAQPAIISERDIVAAVADRLDLDHATGGDLATRPLITVNPEERVIDVARLLCDRGVRHVAIAEPDEVVAIISMRDLVEVLSSYVRDRYVDPAQRQ